MNTEVEDILNASIVFTEIALLYTSQEIDNFRNLVGSEIQRNEGLQITGPPPGLTGGLETAKSVLLPKERILIHSSPQKTICRIDYPDKNSLARLVEVATFAIESRINQSLLPTSFGYNVELVYDQISDLSASQYIARRILSLAPPKWNVMGGVAAFSIEESPQVWNIKIEPRMNEPKTSKVFLSVNCHFNESRFPDREETQKYLLHAWEQAYCLIKRIDENVIT